MSLHLHDPQLHALARMLMRDGKKHASLRIIDVALRTLRETHGISDAVGFAHTSMELAKPLIEVRKHRVSGRTLLVPTPCSQKRQTSLGLRFIRDAFRQRKELGGGKRLAAELMDIANGRGAAWKRREELHRSAEANRAFAHYSR